MWRLKQFMPKEPVGLEGRIIDVGNLKIHVRNAIAEGGFSCVYSARDATHVSKQYALKHMICNDEESLELAVKEINVMRSLKGHPNVVTLLAHAVFDMGRTKEVILVMDFCEKSLVAILESRGSAYYEEKQALSVFRDVCNAVFVMHSQSPPIAHRLFRQNSMLHNSIHNWISTLGDLKAENLLLGSDGSWKLCDFGSTTTNHKCFDTPGEMGIEEDNIRKYTTPAYRAPEMWDLLRRDVISEKVDIWALGCLLFRICYLKNAFDGESKLQILNGNYRIPESPKYSSALTDLIKDMLQSSPDDRPDITQVWFRVNEQLPVDTQKALPDGPPEMQSAGVQEGLRKAATRSHPMPRRSPLPAPSSVAGGSSAQLGAFWSSQHAKDSLTPEDKGRPKFDEEPSFSTSGTDKTWHGNHASDRNPSPVKEENIDSHAVRKTAHVPNKSAAHKDGTSKDFEINFFPKDEKPKASKTDGTSLFKDEGFNTFVAEFDSNKLNSGAGNNTGRKGDSLQAEIEKLKAELKQANLEKAEIASKYEKLSAICRSQRQEIHELKQDLASKTPSPNKHQASPGTRPSAAGKADCFPASLGPQEWQPFSEATKPQEQLLSKGSSSVVTRNGNQKKQADQQTSDFGSWGFGTESFSAIPTSSNPASRPGEANNSKRSSGSKIMASRTSAQPSGWAGF